MWRLLADSRLPDPDEVEYREDSVVFLWHDTKAAVVIDVTESTGQTACEAPPAGFEPAT